MKAWVIKKGKIYSTSKESTLVFGRLTEAVFYSTKGDAQVNRKPNETVVPVEIKEIK